MTSEKLNKDWSDARVSAIRADRLVGHGSCSMIDECMGDAELIGELNDARIHAPKSAVKWARNAQRLWLENGLNQREGNDDDPQLLEYNAFEKEMRKS